MIKTKGIKEWSYKNLNIYKGYSNNYSCCLSEDTRILMHNLEEKSIKDLQIGDKIIGLIKKKDKNLIMIIKKIEKLSENIRKKIRLKDSIINKLNLNYNKIR